MCINVHIHIYVHTIQKIQHNQKSLCKKAKCIRGCNSAVSMRG